MEDEICMSYCIHGGVCVLRVKHKIHDSGYCTWTDKEGLSKDKADKIMIAKNPILGKFIVDAEEILLKKLGKLK